MGIDICGKAIDNAKKLAKKMSIKNVSFKKAALKDIGESYDMVVSICTINENIDQFDVNHFDPIFVNGKKYKEALRSFAIELCSVANEGGFIINIGKHNMNAMELGWMLALEENGVNVPFVKELLVPECGIDSVFCMTAGFYKDDSEIDGEVDAYILFNTFALISCRIKGSEAQYQGISAQLYYQNSVRDSVYAFKLYNEEGFQVGMIGVFTDDDPTSVFVYEGRYTANDDFPEFYLYNYDIDQKDELVLSLKKAKKEAIGNGVKAISFTFPKEFMLEQVYYGKVPMITARESDI